MASAFSLGPVVNRLATFGGPSVWIEFTPLAKHLAAVNLGQGFPDWSPPDFVTQGAQQCLETRELQRYARSQGQPSLVETIARHYGPRLGRTIDPLSEVLVTNGASQALSLSFMSLVEKGDEVILVEPAFDIYVGAIAMAGAKPVYVPMTPTSSQPQSSSEWTLSIKALEDAITPNTRALVLNSPHNPTGKIFSRREYESIAEVLRRHPRIIVISDEVYERLTFDGEEHVPFVAAVPDFYERTVSIYSAGKMFSVTGWKIGWMVGPASIVHRAALAQQFVVFSVCTPLQEAIAQSLDAAEQPYKGFNTYYEYLQAEYTRKRSILVDGMRAAGFSPCVPQGGFFVMASLEAARQSIPDVDLSRPPPEHSADVESGLLAVDNTTLGLADYNFCRHLSYKHKVTAIPPTAFYRWVQDLIVSGVRTYCTFRARAAGQGNTPTSASQATKTKTRKTDKQKTEGKKNRKHKTQTGATCAWLKQYALGPSKKKPNKTKTKTTLNAQKPLAYTMYK
eukprot:m.235614 g.235614  ORF g.235614 m.235614 type:complete len:508 (-) comp18927_c0_seq11:1529-3052(-)